MNLMWADQNGVPVRLEPEQIDRLVAPHLMAFLIAHSENVAKGLEPPDDDIVHCLLRVVEVFSTPAEFEAFMAAAPEINGETK